MSGEGEGAPSQTPKAPVSFKLMKVPGFHGDRVDVQIGNVDVARTECSGLLPLARIGSASMGDLVAATTRKWEFHVSAADRGELG